MSQERYDFGSLQNRDPGYQKPVLQHASRLGPEGEFGPAPPEAPQSGGGGPCSSARYSGKSRHHARHEALHLIDRILDAKRRVARPEAQHEMLGPRTDQRLDIAPDLLCRPDEQ